VRHVRAADSGDLQPGGRDPQKDEEAEGEGCCCCGWGGERELGGCSSRGMQSGGVYSCVMSCNVHVHLIGIGSGLEVGWVKGGGEGHSGGSSHTNDSTADIQDSRSLFLHHNSLCRDQNAVYILSEPLANEITEITDITLGP